MKKTLSNFCGAILIGIILLGIIACKEPNGYLRIQPECACPGEPATLIYRVSNTTEAAIEPGIGAVEISSGSVVTYPEGDTRFKLRAKNDDYSWRSVAETTFKLVDYNDKWGIQSHADIVRGVCLWQTSIPSTVVSENVLIDAVYNTENFGINITHRNKTAYVSKTQSTYAFSDLPLEGDWTFEPNWEEFYPELEQDRHSDDCTNYPITINITLKCKK